MTQTCFVEGVASLDQMNFLHQQFPFSFSDFLADHALRLAIAVEEDRRPERLFVVSFEENVVDLDEGLFRVQPDHADFLCFRKLKFINFRRLGRRISTLLYLDRAVRKFQMAVRFLNNFPLVVIFIFAEFF